MKSMLNMRRFLWTPALLVFYLWLSAGCKQIDKLTQFNIDYTETITLPSTIGINLPFNLKTPSIKTNSEEIFEVNDTRKNLIEELKLTRLTMTISDPADADFSFLKSIEIYIGAENLDEVMVAWKDEVDDLAAGSIDLETSNEDLTDYIIAEDFYLKITTITDELILTSHDIEVQAGFFVDAKILGI